jgi:dipeptidase D
MQPIDHILERFEQISSVPRGTKQEARIRTWLQDWAAGHDLLSRTDAVGNLVLVIPGSPGYEQKPPIILQGHMDMVWQKTADSQHDFTRDPIRILRDGDWLKADRTTLGADNGIAIALMLALAEDAGAAHPPLEFLFTVEEEVGVVGADNLDPGMLAGRTLINLDSEEDGVFTIGCAGGCTVFLRLPVAWEPAGSGYEFFRLQLSGLQGGHSGGDIHKHRANANKVLARALAYMEAEAAIRLARLQGGTVRNAIPRDAEAILACERGKSGLCRQRLSEFHAIAAREYASTEPGLTFALEPVAAPAQVVSLADSKQMIRLVLALPNGVVEMSAEMDGSVETSNNVGIIELLEDGFHVTSNQRSSVASRLEEITSRVEAIAQLAGATTLRNKMTLPWQPDRQSPLLKKCLQVYEAHFGEKPVVETTHGGLECGILSLRCGGLDAISLGPTIVNPHSPDERLFVPSVTRVWSLLLALLQSF